jgi:outer membrane receptor protein involved in Fe transport
MWVFPALNLGNSGAQRHLAVAIAVASFALANTALAQLEEVTVTAQRRSESLQEVPISVTAFDASALEAKQITTVADLRYTAPNVSYSKGNFTGSNFKIRGIGQDLVAATADGGVGIHVNDVPLQASRLFETEYYDLDQLIVLRGPQGTLYGRNSTGGAVNMITQRASTEALAGNIEGQYGNYDSVRLKGMVNVPLSDSLAVRLAGISLNREGYTDNLATGNDIDDRDQWSLRGSLQWLPGDNTTINLMASYMEENSSRTRSPKQLCQNDPSALLGCLPDKLAYEAVNPLAQLTGVIPALLGPLGPQPGLTNDTSGVPRNMRKIAADTDPQYKSDETLIIGRLDHSFKHHDLALIGGYMDTSVRSKQDYNMSDSTVEFFPSPLLPALAPITYQTYFADNTLPISRPSSNNTGIVGGNIAYSSNYLDGYDISADDSHQYSFEANVSSNYDGPLNFMTGLFYLDYESANEYWVLGNGLDYFSVVFPAVPIALGGLIGVDGLGWVSPSFHSETEKYQLESAAAFGELYYDLTDTLKLTTGLRYTVDNKTVRDNSYLLNFDPDGIPILQAFGADENYSDLNPARKDSKEWKEWTGRVVLDWSPEVDWSDDTLLYGSYARGYKGGGFNPPFSAREFPDTSPYFEPEYVDAFEIGTKNQLLDNRLQVNITAFFYDYADLQVSKIINRTSFNENNDAQIYGLENELLFAPTPSWLLNANIAYLHTEVKNYASVDTRDPTQGSSEATLLKDNQNASNCVVFHNGAAAPDMSQLNSCTSPTLSSGEPLPAPYTVGTGVEVDLDGNQLRNSPETTVSLGAQYTWYLDRVNVSTRLDYYWQDAMWGREFNRNPIDKIDSFDVWNAQATLSSSDDRWYVRAYIKNIMNDDSIVGMYVSDPSSGLFTNVFPVEPRLYGLTLGYNFQ